MKTHDKLLILAAKACGMPPPVDSNGVWSAWVGTPETGHWWDPLADDGDALRLAHILGMDVDMCACWIQYDGESEMEVIEFEGSSLENVRRAIVRAAAAIGEAMP